MVPGRFQHPYAGVQLRRFSLTNISPAGAFRLGDRTVKRMGYGAMQLAGPGVFGPPRDRGAAIAVLREAVASGVDHRAARLATIAGERESSCLWEGRNCRSPFRFRYMGIVR